MARVVVAVDPAVGVGARDLAAAWGDDAEAVRLGSASVDGGSSGVFLPWVVEWVVIPLAVNVASSVLYDVVKRLVAGRRPSSDAGRVEVEVVVSDGAEGDRVVVVRVDGSAR